MMTIKSHTQLARMWLDVARTLRQEGSMQTAKQALGNAMFWTEQTLLVYRTHRLNESYRQICDPDYYQK